MDAFKQDWSQHWGYANPPWCLIHQCLSKVKNPVSTSSVDNFLVENPVVVSNSAGAPGELPGNSSNPARSSSDPSRTGDSDETGSAPTDCLAYLRQSYSSQGFSPEASRLMLASWIRPTPTIVPPLLNGLAGVTNRVEIPFQDL